MNWQVPCLGSLYPINNKGKKKRRIMGMWDVFTKSAEELFFWNISSNPKDKSNCRILKDVKRNIENSVNVSYFINMNSAIIKKLKSVLCVCKWAWF